MSEKGNKKESKKKKKGEEVTAASTPEPKRKNAGLMVRAKKKMASKAGPSLFNKFADEETQQLLKLMEEILGQVTDVPTAARVKKYIIVVSAKCIILYQNKMLNDAEWSAIAQLFRRIAVLFRNLFWTQSHENATKAVSESCDSGEPASAENQLSLTEPAMARINTLSSDIERRLTALLSPHFKKKTMGKLKVVIDTMSKDEVLQKAVTDPRWPTFVCSLSHFLQ